ncbi:MAG: nucleotidyl transferase AbiEii/AbiGii toxin family protein [Agriterribacter sp.]
MKDRLHWHTVTPLLQLTLIELMKEPLFKPFRLVGGTSLSLQKGHRKSEDIDLFTEKPYGSLNFDSIDKWLRKNYTYVSHLLPGPIGMGLSYLIGNSPRDAVKLDMFYTDEFIRPAFVKEHIRFANIEDIIAMKIDIIQRKARKKDFWDIHALLDEYTVKQMIALHKEKYTYAHDEKLIIQNFTNFLQANDDLDPICLLQKHWEVIRYEIAEAVAQSFG